MSNTKLIPLPGDYSEMRAQYREWLHQEKTRLAEPPVDMSDDKPSHGQDVENNTLAKYPNLF